MDVSASQDTAADNTIKVRSSKKSQGEGLLEKLRSRDALLQMRLQHMLVLRKYAQRKKKAKSDTVAQTC